MLQNYFSLHGDGLAYIRTDAFSSFTPMFFWKTLMPLVTTRVNSIQAMAARY